MSIKRNLRGGITVDIHASYAHGPRLAQVCEVRGGTADLERGGGGTRPPAKTVSSPARQISLYFTCLRYSGMSTRVGGSGEDIALKKQCG